MMAECAPRRRYRRRRSAQVLAWDPWYWECEPGDLMVTPLGGHLYRLEASRGRGSGAAGVLYCRLIRPPDGYTHAVIENGEVWWVRKEGERCRTK